MAELVDALVSETSGSNLVEVRVLSAAPNNFSNMNTKYNKTIAIYRKLGEKYVENIKNLTPPEIFEYMDLFPEKGKILDIACAGGRDSRVFLDNGFEIIGVDIVENFVKQAKKNNPGGDFLIKDILKLDFQDETFDGIWSHATLLHFSDEDAGKILKSFYKILKPGGELFIGVKEGSGFQNIIDKLSEGEERYFNFFTEDRIKKLIEAAGFKITMFRRTQDDADRTEVKWLRMFAEK